jgi:hypothetical protein
MRLASLLTALIGSAPVLSFDPPQAPCAPSIRDERHIMAQWSAEKPASGRNNRLTKH